jgi:DNA modification methylase
MLAMFPEELPHRLIKMFSFPEETVLDPFMGSGTTALAAKKLGRNSVGYEINPQINGQATDYLKNKLRGQRVFLKYDEQKYDSQNHLLAYLYLENKTFVNAHLLKERLADVDENENFKYKQKFLNI